MAITYDRVPLEPRIERRRGVWARLLDRFIEARQRTAMEQIKRYHGHLLPSELDQAGWKRDGRDEESLPFVR